MSLVPADPLALEQVWAVERGGCPWSCLGKRCFAEPRAQHGSSKGVSDCSFLKRDLPSIIRKVLPQKLRVDPSTSALSVVLLRVLELSMSPGLFSCVLSQSGQKPSPEKPTPMDSKPVAAIPPAALPSSSKPSWKIGGERNCSPHSGSIASGGNGLL
eukprot:CAMPEP_0115145476 /NCGR_PEP_ID=MMETSP0227-20121206/62139_1 /TAXON_ID=89957 /ORGANISM="Polarella glacialis, Strain CCMP 1383" /LENGTH=156 /DNA_ID=CAMNT_0002555003 /DNA_START=304 /DNA_END=774 /DNA_ORIENTATION=-